MTKNTITKIIIALVVIVAILGGVYSLTREKIPEGSICLNYGNKKVYFQLEKMETKLYSGETTNNAGKTKTVEGMGCTLEDVLKFCKVDLSKINGVEILSSDNFSAKYEASEISGNDKMCLLIDEDGSVFSVVFNDTYGNKRKVKNVEIINVY